MATTNPMAPDVTSTDAALSITFHAPHDFDGLVWWLAEGEHILGSEVSAAAYAIVQWPNAECPWGRQRHVEAY